MPYPAVYRSSGDSIASYDYFDIAEGTGVIRFYGSITGSGALVGQMATQEQLYSGGFEFEQLGIESYGNSFGVSTSFAIVVSKTFETTLNLPKIMNGTLVVNSSHRAVATVGSRQIHTFTTATVYKNDTQIGTASGAIAIHDEGASTYDQDFTNLIRVPVTRTKFRKNDEIKIKVDVYGKVTTGGGVLLYLAHDPAGRDPNSTYTNGTSKLIFNIPFVVDT